MLDPDKIGASIRTFGWPKAMYFVCLLLLFRHVVTFEQCLILLFVALALGFLPPELRALSRKATFTRERKKNRSVE